MDGRTEHELKIKERIEKKLNGKPDELWDFYFNIQVSKEMRTCENYIEQLIAFLNYVKKDPLDVTGTDVAKYFSHLQYLANKDGSKRKSSSSYKQIVWSSLNQFYIFLVKSKKINENPLDMTQRPKTQKKENQIFLSMDDLNKILKAVDDIPCGGGSKFTYEKWKVRDKLVLYLLMTTGMRRNALTEINCNDVDTDNMILTVIDKRNKIQKYPITLELLDMINKWLNVRDSIVREKHFRTDALFITPNGLRISAITVYDLVMKYSKYALGNGVSPHKLRAAFVTLYYEASGNDIHATCEAVGHANIATTNIYIRRQNNARNDACNFMAKNLRNY